MDVDAEAVHGPHATWWNSGTEGHPRPAISDSQPRIRPPSLGPIRLSGEMCYRCYDRCVATTVTHRDLRNRSGEVLHAVEAGETYTVTSRGRPVARLVPITDANPDLPLRRPAVIRGGFAQLLRHSVADPSAETIDDLRGER